MLVPAHFLIVDCTWPVCFLNLVNNYSVVKSADDGECSV